MNTTAPLRKQWPAWMGTALEALGWPADMPENLRKQYTFGETVEIVMLALQKDPSAKDVVQAAKKKLLTDRPEVAAQQLGERDSDGVRSPPNSES